MKDVRIKATETEDFISTVLGKDSNYKSFNMSEDSINTMIETEKSRKFNEEQEKFIEEMNAHNKALEEITSNMGVDPSKLEIKPMFDHILIKPFSLNPFQKIQVKNGLIIDNGGLNPNVEKNSITGKYEEKEQIILTGCVMEVGPTVKYLKVGDVVFYHRRNAIPVPFFKQGFYDLGEYHVLSVVNESLSERFKEIK